MCSVQVGGRHSSGSEDGDRARQDEVHQTALQARTLAHVTFLCRHRKMRTFGAFLTETNVSFLSFVFREVFNFEKYRNEAVSVFLAHRAAMHPVTSGLVAKDLKVDASNTTSL